MEVGVRRGAHFQLANGARVCRNKPLLAASLANAIADFTSNAFPTACRLMRGDRQSQTTTSQNMRTKNTKTKAITKIDMKTKQLGNSDLSITPIGFGAWAIGGSGWEFGWGEQDDKASVAAIHRALELGVNWIDTAAVYGMGHSEEVVEFALRTWPGPRPYVFTKCGLRWDEQGYVYRSLNAHSIRRECEDSLRRLNIDVIDLYQIHWPTEDLEEGWGAMAHLQKEGKVRWIGVSTSMSMKCVRPKRSLQSLRCSLHILYFGAKSNKRFCLIVDRTALA
jgi:hypothetical protein